MSLIVPRTFDIALIARSLAPSSSSSRFVSVEPVVGGQRDPAQLARRARRRACATARRWRGAPCARARSTSPSRRLARAHVYATRLIASVALRVKTISSVSARVDESCDLAAAVFVRGGGLLGDRVHAAVDVGVVRAVAVVHRVEHRERLLRRRRRVEVDEALAVDLAPEDREVALDRGDVEGGITPPAPRNASKPWALDFAGELGSAGRRRCGRRRGRARRRGRGGRAGAGSA